MIYTQACDALTCASCRRTFRLHIAQLYLVSRLNIRMKCIRLILNKEKKKGESASAFRS